MVKTLDELKAENAQSEAETEAPPQAVEEEVEQDAAEVETEEFEMVAEPEQDEAEEIEAESWMVADEEEETNGDAKFTGSDIKAAKAKLKAKLSKEKSENERLRERLEALERGQVQAPPVQPQQLKAPKREDFYDHDDPDAAFIQATIDYNAKRQQEAYQAQQRQHYAQQQQQARQQQIDSQVNSHYERVAALTEKSNITADQYRNAELSVRSNIESVIPGGGDHITEMIMANLGEGSEKVIYKSGVCPRTMREVTARLQQDPTGLQAMVFLGELKAKLKDPQKKKSKAPKPAAQISGDTGTSKSAAYDKRAYDKAGSIQDRINIKMAAKRAGVDVTNW